MGKRELLLVAAFVIVGGLVYQFSAPPPAPGERSFSLSQLTESLRRSVRGNRAAAELTSSSAHPVDAGISELRLSLRSSEISVVGEDRADIAAELRIHSTGYDEAEAQQLAKETMLKVDRAGPRLVMGIDYPENGRQTVRFFLKVPARLQLTIDAGSGKLEVTGVNSVTMANQRGDAEITKIAGRVSGTHRGGTLTVLDAGSIKITTVGSDLRVEQIRGDAMFGMRAGELKGSDIVGPIDIDSTSTDVALEKLDKATGMLRINAAAGSLSLKGLRGEGRIDVRNTDVDVTIERAAPLAIYSEGNQDVEVTPPAGGYQLDAAASDGHITLPPGTLQVATTGPQQRATGPIRGGGPTITIRTTKGDITVRTR
jgi:putative adhesin